MSPSCICKGVLKVGSVIIRSNDTAIACKDLYICLSFQLLFKLYGMGLEFFKKKMEVSTITYQLAGIYRMIFYILVQCIAKAWPIRLMEHLSSSKAIPIFIFVSRPREGRFLAFHQKTKTKKTNKCIHVLICRPRNKNKIWNGLSSFKSQTRTSQQWVKTRPSWHATICIMLLITIIKRLWKKEFDGALTVPIIIGDVAIFHRYLMVLLLLLRLHWIWCFWMGLATQLARRLPPY